METADDLVEEMLIVHGIDLGKIPQARIKRDIEVKTETLREVCRMLSKKAINEDVACRRAVGYALREVEFELVAMIKKESLLAAGSENYLG